VEENEQRAAPAETSLKRLRLALLIAVALLVVCVVALAVLRPSSSGTTESASPAVVAAGAPSLTWAAGERLAPDFRLTDEHGRAVSVSALRGRNVVVTFADPHCTTFCPRESRVLNDALRAFPPAERPAVISVSVDPKTRSLAVLRKEAKRFKWLPQWRWAAGSEAELAQVWDDYDIAVVPTDDDINHTEAAYLVDRDGNERALFLWPFKAPAVVDALKALS
jgi:cytochrome oxidase Cu insertion factor (SCO1/SenC/PrrC family)